jgi:4'-phosphopantetheinyl transferase
LLTPLALPREQIHLWLVFQDEIQDEALLCSYRELLTDEERAREQRFHFLRGRREFLITRALVRTVLSRYSNVRPEQWRFSATDFGRPEIVAPGESDALLSFNLAHTGGLIVCAVAHARALGVDVEHLREGRAPLDIAHRYFAPAETSALHALPGPLQPDRFFDYWTLKESYIKAMGKGLSLPLDQFSFDLCVERDIKFRAHAPVEQGPTDLRFWLLKPSAAHVAAVCAEQTGHEKQILVVRQTVPLVSDRPFACAVVRQSAE